MRPTSLALLLTALLLASPAFAGDPPPAKATSSARAAALVHKLRTQRLRNVKLQAVSLEDLLKWLRTATGSNFVIDRTALSKAGVEPADVTFTAELDDVTVATILHLALDPHDLAAVVTDNLVTITTKAASYGKPVTRLHAISHITYTKVDFIGPDINLHPSDFTPVEEYEPEKVVEDDPLTSGDAVMELVKTMVATELWDTEGWTIRATDRYLVVRAPIRIQAEVAKALDVIASIK